MDQPPPPQQADPALQLQRDLHYQVAHTLRATLPPPLANTQEALDRRDRAAIALVASLCPANADEATIAAQYVAANAHAMDCMRLMRRNAGYPAAAKLEAQARSMMREARGARSLLLRVQAARHKREKDTAAREQDAWAEQAVLGLMSDALGHAEPAPAATPRPRPAPAPVAARRRPVAAAKPNEAAEPERDLAAEADSYAILYPRRARLIRRLGGLPSNCDFGPPEPELVHAIVTGTSPALRALDTPAAAAA
jgi:hypothetical protein